MNQPLHPKKPYPTLGKFGDENESEHVFEPKTEAMYFKEYKVVVHYEPDESTGITKEPEIQLCKIDLTRVEFYARAEEGTDVILHSGEHVQLTCNYPTRS